MNRVFFFSGTGNSYYVAKEIASGIEGVLRPIVTLKKGEEVEGDILVFVFPVYDFKPPKKVTEIIEELGSVRGKTIVAIGTYGVSCGATLKKFEKTLKEKGLALSQGYNIKMPHNAVGSTGFTEAQNNLCLLKAEEKIQSIIKSILKTDLKILEKAPVLENLIIIRQLPKIMRLLTVLIFKGAKALEFTVTEDCIDCQRCEKICPVSNIQMINKKPDFQDKCTGCFACIQWCPKSAIRIGQYSFEAIGLKHYHHPKVKSEELIRIKSS